MEYWTVEITEDQCSGLSKGTNSGKERSVKYLWAVDIAQQVKVLAGKPDENITGQPHHRPHTVEKRVHSHKRHLQVQAGLLIAVKLGENTRIKDDSQSSGLSS